MEAAVRVTGEPPVRSEEIHTDRTACERVSGTNTQSMAERPTSGDMASTAVNEWQEPWCDDPEERRSNRKRRREPNLENDRVDVTAGVEVSFWLLGKGVS